MKKNIKDALYTVALVVVTTTIFISIAWYGYHIWSDCLNENSFLTCNRMLTKP